MKIKDFKKYSTVFVLIFFSKYVFSKNYIENSFLQVKSVSFKIIVESPKQKKINDNAEKLLKQYNQEHSSPNKNAKRIISDVFEAKKTANDLDRINKRSNFLFKNAIDLSKESNNNDFEIWTNLNYGFYLYGFRKYEECYSYFMFCVKKLNEENPNNLVDPIETYKKVSYFLITANENDLAIGFLKKAEKIVLPESLDMATIKDNIGLAYLNKNQLSIAKRYFEEALQISIKINNQTREAKALGNLAEVDFRNKNYANAISKIKNDISISEKMHNDQNTMFALIKICKFYLKINNISEAEKAINKAEIYANSKPYFKSSLFEINEFILEIAKKQENNEKELNARRALEILKDSLKTLDGQDVINSVGWEMGKQNLEYNIQLEKNKYQKQFYIKIIAFLICGVLIVILIFIVLLSKRRSKNRINRYENNILTLKMEKLISENKLNSKTKSLISYRNYLLEKTNQIQELEAELEKTKTLEKPDKFNYGIKLDDLLKSHLLTAENWNNFKEAFENEKPEYAKNLTENFPDLTEANLRVIYLSQMQLNNTEIARILGVTLFAVKKAKQRLRAKYKDDYDKFFDSNS